MTDSKGKISPANLEAIFDFQRRGGLFTLATGRMPHHIKTLPFSPNAPVICINGTVIYDHKKGELLREFPLDSYYGDVIDYFDKTHGNEIVDYEAYRMDDYDLVEDGKVGDIKERYEKSKVYKLLFRFQKSDDAYKAMTQAQELYGDRFLFNRSWPFGLEMHSIGSGKGKGLILLKDELCQGIHTTVSIGDYENDICMLNTADISYATGNAPDHVKAKAQNIAPSHDDNAVCHVIDRLKEEILKQSAGAD